MTTFSIALNVAKSTFRLGKRMLKKAAPLTGRSASKAVEPLVSSASVGTDRSDTEQQHQVEATQPQPQPQPQQQQQQQQHQTSMDVDAINKALIKLESCKLDAEARLQVALLRKELVPLLFSDSTNNATTKDSQEESKSFITSWKTTAWKWWETALWTANIVCTIVSWTVFLTQCSAYCVMLYGAYRVYLKLEHVMHLIALFL